MNTRKKIDEAFARQFPMEYHPSRRTRQAPQQWKIQTRSVNGWADQKVTADDGKAYDAYAARTATLKKCADIVRKHYPTLPT